MRGRRMAERIIFTPEADMDVSQAYEWYESREPGLGEEFLRSVESTLLTIQRHPKIFPIAVDEFRHTPIRRFPFQIFYELTDRGIVVYSVFHCSQDPSKWRRRIGFE